MSELSSLDQAVTTHELRPLLLEAFSILEIGHKINVESDEAAEWLKLRSIHATNVDSVFSSLTNEGVLHLSPLLTHLDLSKCWGIPESTPASLFARFPSLLALDVSSTELTDSALSKLPISLEELNIVHCDVTNNLLLNIPTVNLVKLKLYYCNLIIDPPSNHFSRFRLKNLYLDHLELGDASLQNLPNTLKHLSIAGTKVTNAIFTLLPQSLEVLDLTRCKLISNPSIEDVLILFNLRFLLVWYCELSSEYLIELRARVGRECEVDFGDDDVRGDELVEVVDDDEDIDGGERGFDSDDDDDDDIDDEEEDGEDDMELL